MMTDLVASIAVPMFNERGFSFPSGTTPKALRAVFLPSRRCRRRRGREPLTGAVVFGDARSCGCLRVSEAGTSKLDDQGYFALQDERSFRITQSNP